MQESFEVSSYSSVLYLPWGLYSVTDICILYDVEASTVYHKQQNQQLCDACCMLYPGTVSSNNDSVPTAHQVADITEQSTTGKIRKKMKKHLFKNTK